MWDVNGATWSDETNEQMKEMGGSFDFHFTAHFRAPINFIITSLVLFLSANEGGMGGSFNCSPTCPIKAKFITYQAILPTPHPTKLYNYQSCLVWIHGPMGPHDLMSTGCRKWKGWFAVLTAHLCVQLKQSLSPPPLAESIPSRLSYHPLHSLKRKSSALE